jgi:hypothetical protein
MATADTPDLSSDFWESRYQGGSSPWDLGQPAPGFQTWVQQQAPKWRTAAGAGLWAGP